MTKSQGDDHSAKGPLERELEREEEKRRSNRYDRVVSVRYRSDQFASLEEQADRNGIPVSTCVRLLSLRSISESRTPRERLAVLLEEENLGPAEEKVREAISVLDDAS